MEQEEKNWHGFQGKSEWPLPVLVASSTEANRADQGNQTLANEYLDSPEVLEEKMEIVCQMIKKSKNLCAYTGAGLSKSSGIPDYTTKSKESIVATPKIKSSLDAQPTYAHCVLTAMERAGFLKCYVQQNHDGLPQKSGFPQEKMNEIHGAWFDPSNPVVQFSGNLRHDLFQWMLQIEETTDMCLCLGMNADRCANTPARRAYKGKKKGYLGTVIINIQRTPLDLRSSIRVWAKLDDAFQILARKLGLGEIKPVPINLPEGDVFTVPYNERGEYDKNCKMILDLRNGAEVFIPVKGAMNEGAKGQVFGKRDGHYSIHLQEKTGSCSRLFGRWWVESALRGAVPQLPIINAHQHQLQLENLRIAEVVPLPEFLVIVQSHRLVEDKESGDNIHLWGLSLAQSAQGVVQDVTWTLHPTFRDPIVRCNKFPFEITRRGWGIFEVDVTITLLPKVAEALGGKNVIETSHFLDFKFIDDKAKLTEIKVCEKVVKK